MVTRMMSSGVYAIPKIDFGVTPVVTNTTPTGPYRGAGRPEAASLVERAVDTMARALGTDPAELRRRNFPPGSAFPFTTAIGTTYDSGEYEAALDEALRLADYTALRAEQRDASRRSRCRAPRNRARVLRGDVGPRRRVRVGRGARRRHRHRRHRERAARAGPRDDVGADRVGNARRAVRVGPRRALRHRARRPRRRHLRISLHATRRFRGARGRRGRARPGAGAGGGAARGVTRRRRRARRRPARGRRRSRERALVGRARGRGRRAGHRRWRTSSTSTRSGSFPFGCHVAVVEIDRETGGVTLAGRSSRSTTAAWWSIRCSRRARCTAVSRRASRRSCTKACATTTTPTRSPRRCSTISCRPRPTFPGSPPRTPSRRVRTIRSARRASASRARPARSPRCGTRCSTRSRRSVWSTSIRRVRPKWCGGRCTHGRSGGQRPGCALIFEH